jgi:hypothetical protein
MKTNEPASPEAPPPREPIPWIEWARECRFQPGSLAGLMGVPLEQLDACWMILFGRPLDDWLLHLRACEMVRLLREGRTVATTASALGFAGEAECATFCRSYYGYDPAGLVRAICRIQNRERRQVKLIFGEETIPLCWAATPLWQKDAYLLCGPNWAWPAGQRRRVPGRNLLINLLHRHLVAGDAKAPNAICALLREPVLKHLSFQFPQADGHMLWDSFISAFLPYLERPHCFDPARGQLEAFLYQAAWCNLCNLVRGSLRRKGLEMKWQNTARGSSPALLNGKPLALPEFADSPGGHLEKRELAESLQKLLSQFTLLLDEQEKIVFELQCHRKRKTALFATALGIVHLPKSRQAREVKRIKDRLRFKLQPLLKKFEQNS